VQAA
jgi:hypothetical protein